jgi:hypothetical protein
LNRTNDITRRLVGLVLCSGLAMALGGCRHKVQIAPLPPVLTPVALEDVPPPPDDKLPMIEVPQIKLPPEPIASAAARPKREKKRTTKTPTVPMVVQAPDATPVESEAAAKDAAVGALTGGGETNPQARQEAADLIASIEKRLNALPTQMTDEEKTQINKVRNFWRDAQSALTSGDAEGAKTLATKAKLLLDDLEK